MKKFVSSVFAAFAVVACVCAAPPSKDWFVDYDQAMEKAKEENKPLLVLLTGSDWCPYCIQLEKDVLKSSSFKNLAKNDFVPVYVDFPRRSADAELVKRSGEIARKLNFRGGYPTMKILKPDGTEIGEIRGYMPKKEYVKKLKSFISEK